MIKVQFISVQTLKAKSVLQQNIDEKILNIAIREFQDIELTRTLGRTAYKSLEDAIIASLPPTNPVVPLSDALRALFDDYITPYMIYGSLMYSIPAIHRKLSNAGVKVDDYQNSTNDDLAAARADYAFKADNYKRNLLEYLAEQQEDSGKRKSNDQDTTFGFTGIALPDAPGHFEERYENAYYKTHRWGNII